MDNAYSTKVIGWLLVALPLLQNNVIPSLQTMFPHSKLVMGLAGIVGVLMNIIANIKLNRQANNEFGRM